MVDSTFLFMVGLIAATAIFLFGASMLARRRSAWYAYSIGLVALAPIVSIGLTFFRGSVVGVPTPWALSLAITGLLVLDVLQARTLRMPLPQAIAGLVGDLGLAVFWILPLAFVEMFVSGDGGPGYVQYETATILVFLGVQIVLPILIAALTPKRASLPPEEVRPSNYPRP